MSAWRQLLTWLAKPLSREGAKVAKVLPDVPVAGAWTVHDRDTLRHFFASDIGRKLVKRMQAAEYALACTNASDLVHTVHAAGVTVGYNHALRHLISLSYSCDVQQEKTNDSGAPGEARPIEGEAADWQARMSP